MKYFIYTRKSQEQDERQALSIEAQLQELRDLSAKEGLEIAASFEEAKTAREPGRKLGSNVSLLNTAQFFLLH